MSTSTAPASIASPNSARPVTYKRRSCCYACAPVRGSPSSSSAFHITSLPKPSTTHTGTYSVRLGALPASPKNSTRLTKSPADASPCPSGTAAKASSTPLTSQTRPWSPTGQPVHRFWPTQPPRSPTSPTRIQAHAAAHATPPPIINGNTARAALATDTCGPRGTGPAASETKS